MSDLELIVQMMGGIGNQLFQYALARRLELERKANVRFDLGMFDENCERALSIRKYRTTVREVSTIDRATTRLSFGRSFAKITSHLGRLGKPLLWQRHFDQANGFEPEILKLTGRHYLSGWWQSPAYFDSIAPTIRNEFQPQNPMTGADAELEKKIINVNAVSVHIRRGDLVTHPIYSKETKVQPAEYYRDGMREMEERLDNPMFFVFSDDPAWARENITGNVTYVDNHDGSSDYVDLYLMSRCRHFVASNSTFSWWAAWLSRNAGKIVIVPSVWKFKVKGPPPDLVPDDWQVGPRHSTEQAIAAGAL